MKNETCPFYIGASPGKNRSPEEYKEDGPLSAMADVFSLGNMLYSLVMKEQVWEGERSAIVQKKVSDGIFPSIPKEVVLSDAEKAVVHAMRLCHVLKVEDRSSAMEVEQYLRKKLVEFNVSTF